MQIRSTLSVLAYTYGALIALWLLLRALFFDSLWPLALANTCAEYLWHSRGLVAVSAATGPSGSSDHLPVVAVLRLAPLPVGGRPTGGRQPGAADAQSPRPPAEGPDYHGE